VEVRISEPAKEYVRAGGGTVYVRAHPHRCCAGTITLLDVTTRRPKDVGAFVAVASDDIHVRFSGGSSGCPDQLVIKLAGVFKRHPVAFWDGCAIKP
jgi:hypothetical protein